MKKETDTSLRLLSSWAIAIGIVWLSILFLCGLFQLFFGDKSFGIFLSIMSGFGISVLVYSFYLIQKWWKVSIFKVVVPSKKDVIDLFKSVKEG